MTGYVQRFWLIIAVLLSVLALYGLYRMTVRPTVSDPGETVPYAPVSASSSPVAVELAQEVYIEAEEEMAQHNNEETAA
jgi:hypothetical protein